MRMEPLRHVNVMSAKRMAFPALGTKSFDAPLGRLGVLGVTYITR
jgi:O-acetyl-ADP-ribose deacetylase (regulator of RNase III)